jgi:hypothetical protein
MLSGSWPHAEGSPASGLSCRYLSGPPGLKRMCESVLRYVGPLFARGRWAYAGVPMRHWLVNGDGVEPQ